MTIGSVICVIGLTMFINPNNLLAGGVWGLSSILNHFFSTIPMGIFIILLNIPLLIWGWNKLHLRFAIYTLYVILLQSILLLFSANILPVYTNDTLLACLIGGVLTGCGSGIIVRYHGSGGGSDIIGIIMKGKYDISIGTITLTVNSLIVLISATLFGLEPAM